VEPFRLGHFERVLEHLCRPDLLVHDLVEGQRLQGHIVLEDVDSGQGADAELVDANSDRCAGGVEARASWKLALVLVVVAGVGLGRQINAAVDVLRDAEVRLVISAGHFEGVLLLAPLDKCLCEGRM